MTTLRYYIVLGTILLLLTGTSIAAPSPKAEASEPIPNKPENVAKRNTTVAVEFEGTDSIGSRLSTRVKELINASNLFSLTEKDAPKIRILISTVSEFPQRPGVGSAYAVIWLFSQSEATLRHYLSREVGVLTAEEVNQVAAKIVEQTDAVAVRYGYLLP